MHTSHPDIQMPRPGRRRGRYSDEFKRQVIAACLEPGVSTAAIALGQWPQRQSIATLDS